MNKRMFINRTSKLFQPMIALQKNTVITSDSISKSSQLMLNNGIVKQSSPGIFYFLPLGVRVLDKLINLIDNELKYEDAQKVKFPTLTHAKLWKATGRYGDVANELFKLQDRHEAEYILSPTHEETSADLISSLGVLSYKKYPMKMYQITSKFRDEMKPRFGLMRARQFIMKDLYSFDIDVEHAKTTYMQMGKCYDNIFSKLNLHWVKVLGTSGTMGGELSHEYHFPADIGEDKLLHCNGCNYTANIEYIQSVTKSEEVKNCPNCGSLEVKITNGIEVGHTFLLGDKYSKAMKSKYLAEDGKMKLLQMGSYGLGISRIIAATVEVLSEETAIKWPTVLAPFKIVVIGPKSGSKEEGKLSLSPEQLCGYLMQCRGLESDVLYDDRSEMTIGKRLLEAKRTGYPFAIVIGEKATQTVPEFELIDMYRKEQRFLSLEQVVDFFSEDNLLNKTETCILEAK